MANITAAMVKALREKTGAGMMDCKKALVEAEGNEEKAIEILRKKGLSKAAKKADRNAAEGVVSVYISDDYKLGSIAEVNCETDFVAKTDEFVEFSEDIVKTVAANELSDVDALMKTGYNEATFEEELKVKIAKIGENIVVRRVATIKADENGVVNGYVHAGGKVGVLVAAACDKAETCDAIKNILKDIAMHIAAMKPDFVDPDSVPAEVIEKEKEIAKAQLLKEGKPENIIEKILPGKVKKVLQDICLSEQEFVKAEKKESVAEALEKAAKKVGGSAKLVDFIRFEVGEGLTKNACSMAEEVAEALK